MPTYSYVIVGAGLAGASAVEGLREADPRGSILLVGREPELPYNRPPLTKQLWSGKQKESEIFVHDAAYYRSQGVEVLLGTTVTQIDRGRKTVRDDGGHEHGYHRLLLATGGAPRRLPIPGGELEGILYYRTLDDYARLRAEARPGRSAVLIGGGFIGSELAAALAQAQVEVTMVFPEPYLVARVFPEGLGRKLNERYRRAGIRLLEERPASIEHRDGRFRTRTSAGREIESDLVIAGIGIAPALELARDAGLAVGDGIVVNERLQTSDPSIFAAGDNALFPYLVLGKPMRVEHWDNAQAQGRHAGRNMAGASSPYDTMPFFFSDLFEFGYEAVGEIDSRLETKAEWEQEYETGVVRYLREGRVRGVMNCNLWNQVETARALIKSDNPPDAARAGAAGPGHSPGRSQEDKMGGQRVSPEQAQELARGFPDWSCDGQTLEREFKFRDFRESMAFVTRVAEAAERADHHPDIHVSYDHVRLELTTHKVGGLTDRDFKLARQIDSVV